MLPEGGTLYGPRGVNLHRIILRLLTQPGQLPDNNTCEALVELAADKIVSQMTPENAVEEMFWNSQAWVPCLNPTRQSTDKEKADKNH